MTQQHGAEQWRHRAHEARIHAATVNDVDCKRMILGIARGYEQIAEATVLVEESAALLRTERIKNPFVLRGSDTR